MFIPRTIHDSESCVWTNLIFEKMSSSIVMQTMYEKKTGRTDMKDFPY